MAYVSWFSSKSCSNNESKTLAVLPLGHACGGHGAYFCFSATFIMIVLPFLCYSLPRSHHQKQLCKRWEKHRKNVKLTGSFKKDRRITFRTLRICRHVVLKRTPCCSSSQDLTWWKPSAWPRRPTRLWRASRPSPSRSTTSPRTLCTETSSWHRAPGEITSPAAFTSLSASSRFSSALWNSLTLILIRVAKRRGSDANGVTDPVTLAASRELRWNHNLIYRVQRPHSLQRHFEYPEYY